MEAQLRWIVEFPQNWRIRVSIPVPRRCERRTLPIELIPHYYINLLEL